MAAEFSSTEIAFRRSNVRVDILPVQLTILSGWNVWNC